MISKYCGSSRYLIWEYKIYLLFSAFKLVISSVFTERPYVASITPRSVLLWMRIEFLGGWCVG